MLLKRYYWCCVHRTKVSAQSTVPRAADRGGFVPGVEPSRVAAGSGAAQMGDLSGAARAALGNNTNFAAALASEASRIRLERFAAQDVARSLLPWSRVAFCLRQQITNVEVRYSRSTGRASYGGLMTCALRWLCPVCSAKLAERDRVALDAVIAEWRKRGGKVALVTLTVSHTRQDALKPLLRTLVDAYGGMTGNRPYKRLKRSCGLKHSVRVTEPNWGNAYGWHAHFHMLWFLAGDADRAAMEDEVYSCWSDELAKYGRSVSRERGVDIRWADADVDAYVTKFGRAWSAAREITGGAAKKGRGGNHYTAFELLQLAGAGKRWAGQRFQEFAEATKGVHQINGVGRVYKALGLGELQDDDVAATAVEPDYITLDLLMSVEWRAVCRYRQRGRLLEVARTGDVQRVLDFVERLVARYLDQLRS